MVNAEINNGQHPLNLAIDDVEERKRLSLGPEFDYIEEIFRDFSELPEIHEGVLDEIVEGSTILLPSSHRSTSKTVSAPRRLPSTTLPDGTHPEVRASR